MEHTPVAVLGRNQRNIGIAQSRSETAAGKGMLQQAVFQGGTLLQMHQVESAQIPSLASPAAGARQFAEDVQNPRVDTAVIGHHHAHAGLAPRYPGT